MQRKITLSAILISALLGSSAAALAQGPAGNSDGAATIPGNEVRAGEMRQPRMSPEMTTGSATHERRGTSEENSNVNVNTPPRRAGTSIDATEVAPAGR